jgi:hypothetical protein
MFTNLLKSSLKWGFVVFLTACSGSGTVPIPDAGDRTGPDIELRLIGPTNVSMAEAYGLTETSENRGLWRSDLTAQFRNVGVNQTFSLVAMGRDHGSGTAFISIDIKIQYACGTWGRAEAREFGPKSEDRHRGTLVPGERVDIERLVDVHFKLAEIAEICDRARAPEPRFSNEASLVTVIAKDGSGNETVVEYPFRFSRIQW